MKDRNEYINNYKKEKLKRVPLDMKKDDFEKVQAAAAAAGESVNGYIKKAIADRMEKGK